MWFSHHKPKTALNNAERISVARKLARKILNIYLEDSEREDCRWCMDFKPAVLPLWVEAEVNQVGVSPCEKALLKQLVLQHFDLLEAQHYQLSEEPAEAARFPEAYPVLAA